MGFLCGNGLAADDITIPDGAGDGTESGWYRSGPSDGSEDNEVEPGCVATQPWDLEAFLYDKGTNTLTAVGGFDFIGGYGGYDAGDIFIDTPKINAIYGEDKYTGSDDGNQNDTFDYQYDYVLDMDYEATTPGYTIYKLDGNDSFDTVYFRLNDESNPYRYVGGGDLVGLASGYSFSQVSYETDTVVNNAFPDLDPDLTGGIHYAISVDLTPLWNYLGYESDFLVHLTMECGNDNMMGLRQGGGNPPVPEPATMLLVGTGLVGLASLRKKFKKS